VKALTVGNSVRVAIPTEILEVSEVKSHYCNDPFPLRRKAPRRLKR